MTWVNYSNTGPFTNNTTPSLAATFFNNIESFLDQFAGSVVSDGNISTNGSGVLTVKELIANAASGTGLSITKNATIGGTLSVTGGATFSGALTVSGQINANGGLAVGSFTSTGQITANNGLTGVLTSIGGGHTLTDWNFGAVAATSSGVSVTHGIQNSAGVATAPTVVVLGLDYAGSPGIYVSAGNITSTTFKVYSSSNATVWWLALL